MKLPSPNSNMWSIYGPYMGKIWVYIWKLYGTSMETVWYNFIHMNPIYKKTIESSYGIHTYLVKFHMNPICYSNPYVHHMWLPISNLPIHFCLCPYKSHTIGALAIVFYPYESHIKGSLIFFFAHMNPISLGSQLFLFAHMNPIS